jgi:hypothetical protein
MTKMMNLRGVRSVLSGREPKALTIALSVLVGFTVACGSGEREERRFPSRTPTMPPSPTATIAAMPSEIPGVVVAPQNETPEATAQAHVTQTPETTASPAPAPAATQEVVQPKNYTIEFIPPDPTKPYLHDFAKHSEEETRQIIESLVTKYPVLGELRFKVALGGGMGFAGEDQDGKLVIEVDRADPELWSGLVHELVHAWDFVIKKQANEQLLSLREQILSDPQIGRSYPNVERMLSGDYTIARMDFQYGTKAFDSETFRVLCSGWANRMWMKSLSFFDQYLFDESWNEKATLIDSEDPGYPNRLTYAHFSDFWQGQRDELRHLAETNHRWAIALSEVGTDLDRYQEYAQMLEPRLLGPDRQAAYEWQALGQLAKVILANKYLNGDSGIADTPEERKRIDRGLEDARYAADAEQIAELVSIAMILSDEGRLTFEVPQIDSLLQGIRNLSGN